jgi:hypothetical protein
LPLIPAFRAPIHGPRILFCTGLTGASFAERLRHPLGHGADILHSTNESFAEKVRADLAAAEKNPNALMITPLVLEIVAEKTDCEK